MAKNHWHTGGTSKARQAAYKHGYKSGLNTKLYSTRA